MISMRVAVARWLDRSPHVRTLIGRVMASIPPGIRLGREFWEHYAFLAASEEWSAGEMAEWQGDRLSSLLLAVRETSPYYASLLPHDKWVLESNTEAVLRTIPVLERETFRERYRDIRGQTSNRRALTAARTSGTTGLALQFVHAADDAIREHAAICHQWARVGYEPGRSIRAEFRGLTSQGRPVEYFPEKPMLRFSILDLGEDRVRFYADVAERERVDFLHGYPSALHLVAEQVLAHGIKFPQPKGILLASEVVQPWQLERVRLAFPAAKLFAHYGCAERVVLAGWCEHSDVYHVLPQYSIVEIDERTSEIIGTNLFNDINPFIRYRMSDVAIDVGVEPCPRCGRPYTPLIGAIGGRSEDYLYTNSRGWICPALLTHPLKGLVSLQEIRFRQQEPDAIFLEYTLRDGRTEDDAENEVTRVVAGLAPILGESARLVAARVDGFERTASGKFKWVVNTMQGDQADGV